MDLFHVISVVVPLIIVIFLPKLLQSYGYKKEKSLRWMLYVACFLFFISWYLPSPLIDGKDTSFTTHFIGGGLFCGLLWIYLYKTIGMRLTWWLEAFSLFALVSALGCVNELFELLMVETGRAVIEISETNWDILANTSGALLVYIIYLIAQKK